MSRDTGHHNCRDYHLPIPSNPNVSKIANILSARTAQKSPLNQPTERTTPFPFLNLPYELRRQVYTYLLPYTETQREARSLLSTLNTTVDTGKSGGASTLVPKPSRDAVLWHRGQTYLLCVNKQFLRECSSLLYGENTFVLFITYDTISFRFRWLLPSGLAPSKTYDFLDLLGGTKYIFLIKRLVVTVDHVDSYTGMIKYNVGGEGLTHGLKLQVRKLVRALGDGEVKRLSVRLLNGNEVLDHEKRGLVGKREVVRVTRHVQTVLEPLAGLTGLVEVDISGAVEDEFRDELKMKMMA